MFPDLGSFAMVLWARWADGYSPGAIRDLYLTDAWQTVLGPWHSFFLWTGLLALGLVGRRPAIVVLAASALVHAICDLPLHANYPHSQLWPFSDWRLHSPVSYSDPNHHGYIIQPIELILIIGLMVFLINRHASHAMRLVVAALGVVYAAQFASYMAVS